MLTDGDSGNRKQAHLLLQATWQSTAQTKFGLNCGESELKDGDAAPPHGAAAARVGATSPI